MSQHGGLQRPLPPNARPLTDVEEVYRRLRLYNGISRPTASSRLHKIKRDAGHNADVLFDRCGGVFAPESREFLGSLTEGGGDIENDIN